MDQIIPLVISSNGIALLIGIFTFLMITILAARQLLNFSMLICFLLFILAASLAVADHDIVRTYLAVQLHDSSKDNEAKTNQIHEKILKQYDSLKVEIEIQKLKIQALSEELKHYQLLNLEKAAQEDK